MNYKDVEGVLELNANEEKAKILRGFFKCGKGEYGEGDKFWGITVPVQRKIAKDFSSLPMVDIERLLGSDVHECRLTALLILVLQFEKGDGQTKKKIFNFYLENLERVNNWDLVDVTTPKIVGAYLLDHKSERKVIHKLAQSKNIWNRRVAILATFTFLRAGDFFDTFRIAEMLLHDEHDLIHKAAGWMLREVGKRDQSAEEKFLKEHCKKMPRTMLRYAVEKFAKVKKEEYMRK